MVLSLPSHMTPTAGTPSGSSTAWPSTKAVALPAVSTMVLSSRRMMICRVSATQVTAASRASEISRTGTRVRPLALPSG